MLMLSLGAWSLQTFKNSLRYTHRILEPHKNSVSNLSAPQERNLNNWTTPRTLSWASGLRFMTFMNPGTFFPGSETHCLFTGSKVLHLCGLPQLRSPAKFWPLTGYPCAVNSLHNYVWWPCTQYHLRGELWTQTVVSQPCCLLTPWCWGSY